MIPDNIEVFCLSDPIIDSDHQGIIAHARKIVGIADRDPIEKAVALYYAVRDGIQYAPYAVSPFSEDYRGSTILAVGRGFCVQKAALLCTLGRACGIPSRIGFATVRNHLASQQLLDFVGTNVFVFHGFTEFWLEGKWVKATPAFNRALCEKNKLIPLEFSGKEDSIFQEYNEEKELFMEYDAYHGTFPTVPMEKMIATWREYYGNDRIDMWFLNAERSTDEFFNSD
jgi:transglutaminase-like putative cysteine protease